MNEASIETNERSIHWYDAWTARVLAGARYDTWTARVLAGARYDAWAAHLS